MTATLEGGEWSAARPGRTLPPGKNRYPFYRRLGGLQGRSGWAENLVPTGIRSRTVQPVVSRYTDWATRPKEHAFNTAYLDIDVLCWVLRYTFFVFQRIQIACERQIPLRVIKAPFFSSLHSVVLLSCHYNTTLSLAIYCFCCNRP